MIYYTQDFDVLNTGYVISGRDILSQLYDNRDVNAWGMIGVLIAYIVFFRLVHYGLFLYASLPFLGDGGAARIKTKPAAGKAQYEKVDKSEVEMV
jgi:hypothetical protein